MNTHNPNLALNEIDDSHQPALDEDTLLLQRCVSGDRQAFGELVTKYMNRAYHTALGFTGDHESALDLSQEAFVRAYRSIRKFEPGRRFFTWYYRILRNLSLNFNRDRARHARSFSEIGELRVSRLQDTTAGVAETVERSEMREIVWQAINQLAPHEREIIILREFQELSYKEIAELMDCPQGTVMSRLYNARKALRAKLTEIME